MLRALCTLMLETVPESLILALSSIFWSYNAFTNKVSVGSYSGYRLPVTAHARENQRFIRHPALRHAVSTCIGVNGNKFDQYHIVRIVSVMGVKLVDM